MRIDVRDNFIGGLDLDNSLLKVGRDSYIDALNITRDAVAGGKDNDITNIVGNQLQPYSLPPGVNQVIGAFGFTLRNTIIYFVWNQYNVHSILQYSHTTNITTKIFQNLTDSGNEDILGFTLSGKITSINVYPRESNEGDLLLFIDSLGRPTIMNIKRFIAGEYTPVTRTIIDLHKRCPLSPPACVYGNDATHAVNNTRNKLYRFCYMWQFDDFEKSVSSPRSAMPVPANALDDEYTNVSTNNNQITVSVNSGPKNVAKILLFVSWVNKTNNWSDFELVEAIDKAELGIADDTDYGYLFYNDSTYPTADVNEMNLLFDYIPSKANCMDMPNGNVVTVAGITEGIDRDLDADVEITINTVEAGGGSSAGSLNAVVTPYPNAAVIVFSGVPATGTIVTVILTNDGTGLPEDVATYTTLDGDVATDVSLAIRNSAQSNGFAAFMIGAQVTIFFDSGDWTYNNLTIEAPSSVADDNSIATWPWSTQRRLGLAYYNEKGVTPGVMYSAGITFPQYSETTPDTVLLPYINAKIFHVPPIWAYSYQWVVTKEPTTWLFFMCTEVNSVESDFIYFNITNLPLNQQKNPTTTAVINWSFADGDRFRLIKNDITNEVYPTSSYDIGMEGIVVDPTINNVATTGTWIKVKNIPPYTGKNYSDDFFVIQLYRPGQQVATDENQVYYEFGVQYPILNPGTTSRVHAGEVTDQSTDYVTPAEVNMYNGDSYFRVRTVYLSETGFGTFFVQDRNFIDNYISAVSSVDGRPLVIDVNQREAYYSATGRFGQAYQANTNINGLNRFYPNDFYDVDISYGDIMRLAVSDRRIWVFQKFKTGQLPIFSQINKQPNGTIVNVVTDQLINPVDYYAGNWGIGDASTSLVIFNYVAYFCDNINGVILRLSKDGLTPLSILYNTNSWANRELPLRTNGYFIYGGYDRKLNNYIISLEAVGGSAAQTLSFAEGNDDTERPSFDGFISLLPENMCSLGTLLASFKEGRLWTHDSETYNSFFGYNYESSYTPVFNEVPLQKKGWMNLTQISNKIWDAPEISTNVNTYNGTPQRSSLIAQDFTVLEGMPTTTIKRDINSNGGKYNGNFMKGNYCVIKLRVSEASELTYLSTVSVEYINSPLTKT